MTMTEAPRIPVPQADDLDKVLEVPALVAAGAETSADIAEKLDMVERQGLYYATAAQILGLVDIDDKHNITLTTEGRQYLSENVNLQKSHARQLVMHTPIIKHILAGLGVKRPRYESHYHLLDDSLWVQDQIEELGYASETALRRAFTIRAWIKTLT